MSVIMPGSYDPVTIGHAEMIRRVAEREDEVYVVVFTNPAKNYNRNSKRKEARNP